MIALGGAKRLDTRGEGSRVLDELFLLEVCGRARGDVHESRALVERLHRGGRRIRAPREHIDFSTQARELRRDLAHVHVHTAGLAAAERRKRRGVHREDRDPHLLCQPRYCRY